jgi:hypothetical protein
VCRGDDSLAVNGRFRTSQGLDVHCLVEIARHGLSVDAEFVSLKGLEVPFYIVLIGVVVMKYCSSPADCPPEYEELKQ